MKYKQFFAYRDELGLLSVFSLLFFRHYLATSCFLYHSTTKGLTLFMQHLGSKTLWKSGNLKSFQMSPMWEHGVRSHERHKAALIFPPVWSSPLLHGDLLRMCSPSGEASSIVRNGELGLSWDSICNSISEKGFFHQFCFLVCFSNSG